MPLPANFVERAAAIVRPYAEAGATWWIESWWDLPDGPDGLAEVRRRVEAGPPVGP